MNTYIKWESPTIKAGQIYGRYLVLSTHKIINTYKYYALCKCSCGSELRYVPMSSLRSGDAKSCGCLHKEIITKHGAWSHRLFQVWTGIMSRCYNNKNKRYLRYGGRGITVTEYWHNVNNFIQDMDSTYQENLKIDRINNDIGYSKDNCRWATSSQQNRNYSRNINIEFNGKSQCLADWATELNIIYGTLWDRLKQGWSIERALTTPVNKKSL